MLKVQGDQWIRQTPQERNADSSDESSVSVSQIRESCVIEEVARRRVEGVPYTKTKQCGGGHYPLFRSRLHGCDVTIA